MFQVALTGFALGFSLILAIGAQNAFVLRQGLKREHVLAVVLACAVSDAILITVGVAGFAQLSLVLPQIAGIMRWLGAGFLFVYGAMAFRSVWQGGSGLEAATAAPKTLLPVVLTCLALTWLNPHVYLDTVLLVGSTASNYPGREWVFGLGAVGASFTFFFSLGYGARFLAPVFARPFAWRALDAVIGVTMWLIALSLVTSALAPAAG